MGRLGGEGDDENRHRRTRVSIRQPFMGNRSIRPGVDESPDAGEKGPRSLFGLKRNFSGGDRRDPRGLFSRHFPRENPGLRYSRPHFRTRFQEPLEGAVFGDDSRVVPVDPFSGLGGVTSLFEGWLEDACVSVRATSLPLRTAVVLHDLIPLVYPDRYLVNPDIHA